MSSTAASKTITELKVSAHLMTLDAGLFCVFNSPGASPPSSATGLPGVRLSAAPAPAGFGGEVGISGFNASGWLGGQDGAALVRVVGGSAQVLVTVYQDPEAQHDAPKLQVIRLTEGVDEASASAPARHNGNMAPAGASPAPGPGTPVLGTPVPGMPVEVAAHIYGRGDVGGLLGEWMGERGSKRWIEGFGLAPAGDLAAADIEYQAVLGRGWISPWSEGGQFCGSRGMSLPILGLRVRLRGSAAHTHKLSISASFVDGTEIGPVSDGEACESPSLSPLEAFQVTLRPLAAAMPAQPEQPARPVRGRRGGAAPAKAEQKAASIPAVPAAATKPKPGRKAAGAKLPIPAPPPKGAAKPASAATRRR